MELVVVKSLSLSTSPSLQVTDDTFLIVTGDDKAHFGMLKKKAQLLKEYLNEPLKQLSTGDDK